MHAALDLGEGEAALLLDDALLRYPPDLVRAPPAVEPQHALQREAKGDHLDLVAGADPLASSRPIGSHLRDPFEDGGDVPVVGEVVEGALGRGI